jgi:23S rRNA (guanosine2251-2'-O)-methyltransferase
MSQRSLIYGFHAVLSRLRHHPASIQLIYLDEGRRDKRAQEVRRYAEEKGVKLVASEASRLEEMAHGKSQGVVAFVEPIQLARTLDEVLEDLTEPALLLILDGVTDPHNLGACLRSADAFGAHAVIVPKDRAASLNATAVKAASGAADTMPFIPVTNLARALRELTERDILIVGTDQDGSLAVADADFSVPAALVLGAEGTGMRRLTREHCDLLVRIPMFGQVESLNVSVSAGVCLYEARRQRAKLES